MIQLSRICLLNWHLLTRADLDLAGDSAILGQNRSGKSTLIDLIQAVMAGGSSKYYRFNRSAGEGGGRSDRTLAGYCLGQLNEDTFIRENGSLTHVALVFEDFEGTRAPVTLGLTIEAERGRAADVVGQFVAEGVAISSSMMIDEVSTGARPTEWAVLRRRLEQQCAAAGGQLHTPDNARAFIREYMRVLFTNRRTSDPERFVRTFVAALSFMDMPSVERFVRNYLLEQRDVEIGELRDSIQRYREIQKTISDLERRLDALNALRILIASFIRHLEEEEIARALERLALLIETGSALIANVLELRAAIGGQTTQNDELKQVENEIARETAALEAVQRQLAASDAASARTIVEGELRELERDHSAIQGRLQQRFMDVARAAQLIGLADRLTPINPGELLRLLRAVQAASAGLAPPDWPRNPADMDALLRQVAAAASGRIPKATAQRDEAIGWVHRISGDLADAQLRLDAASAGRVSLQRGTVALMDTLRREGMSPRTLCEVAEVVDERWRGPVEALLVRDRETVIVDPRHAQRATEILRRNRQAYPGGRVANTRRLQGQTSIPRESTLASMLRSDDDLAMAFAVFRIGNVSLAEDQDSLLAGGRAVMDDGAYYDGLVTEMRRADEFKIGRAAAPLMKASLVEHIDELTALRGNHERNAKFFDDVIRRLEACAVEVADEGTLDAIVLAIDDLAGRREGARRRLAAIAASIDPALLDEESRAKGAIASMRVDRDELLTAQGASKNAIAEVRRRLGTGEGQIGSYLSVKQRRKLFGAMIGSSAALQELREPYRKAATGRTPAKVATAMATRAAEAQQAHRDLAQDIRSAVGNYAYQFPDALEGYAQADISTTVRAWVDEGIAALEGNELIQYRAQADEAADRVSRLFRTTFIHELNSRFGTLLGEMETLKRALSSRPLHGDIYELHALPKVEFQDLYHLARDSEHDEATLDALFGRAEPRDERHARALKQVEHLLSDETHDFTAFQDYRNYFTFDLRLKDVATGRSTSFDKRRGVASGAERQVPFYVVIGAALASIYHGSRQTAPTEELGIGLAVFDEAFSKMDGPNQRTLLEFYRSIGLQVVIAAPSEKRAVIYENLHSIIDVFRSGDTVLAESLRIKGRARDEMRSANPQHASNEQLAERYGLEDRAAE